MNYFGIKKITFFSLFLIIVALMIGKIVPKVWAQSCVSDRNQGLVSSSALSGLFGNPTGQCVIDPKAAYANFKVPTFDEMKSLFYTQNKVTPKFVLPISGGALDCPTGMTNGSITLQNLQNLPNFGSNNALVDVQCQFTHISDAHPFYGPLSTSNNMIIVFVESHLYIDSNLTYGGENYGLVFVVKGDVYIQPTVTQINAVIIAEGNIYTTSPAGIVPNSNPLVVNGSLISLGQTGQRIYFNRSLVDNSKPAETVNFQPKYLVLLRGLMTQSFTIQREIEADEIPNALPSPTILPSPTATVNPGSTFSNPYCVYSVYRLFDILNISAVGTSPYPSPFCP